VAVRVVLGYATFTALLGTLAVVMVRVPAIVKLYTWVAVNAVGVVLSVTLAVKVKGPDAVGIPLRTPPELSVIPAGNAPALTVQV